MYSYNIHVYFFFIFHYDEMERNIYEKLIIHYHMKSRRCTPKTPN